MSEKPEVPEQLWKYREWNDYARRLVVHGELYYAKSSELNDPFEFRWREKYPQKEVEIDAFARQLCAATYPDDSPYERSIHYQDMLAEARNYAARAKRGPLITATTIHHGLFCASEVNDDILMWSHYARNHSGICVGFKFNIVSPKVFLPVNYTTVLPTISVWMYANADRQVMVDLSRTKAQHWAYEREWRTLYDPGIRAIPNFVDTIIIGALALEKTKREVLAAAKEAPHEITIRQAKLSDRYFALEIHDS